MRSQQYLPINRQQPTLYRLEFGQTDLQKGLCLGYEKSLVKQTFDIIQCPEDFRQRLSDNRSIP
jgi:hypothetical protein